LASITRIRRANAASKIELIAAPRPREQQWKSQASCRTLPGSNLWEKDGEHAKRRFSITSGATFNVAKDRRKLTIFGNFARQQPGFANSRSRSSKEWSRICRKSTNEFAVIARIMNFGGSQRLIATSFAWQSTKCFIETTYRQSCRLTKQLNWQKCMVAANRVVSSTVFLIA